MRDIFTLIASFVRTQTRSPGVLWLRQKLSLVGTLLYARRKQIVAGLFVAAICGVYLGVSGTVFAQNGPGGTVGPTAALPAEYKKSGILDALNPITWALRIFNEVVSMLVGLVGKLALFLVSVLMNIAQYNDFLSSSAVANGWVVTRDIANMFFIIILLVIAFGTILGSGEYNTKMLGKLLVMAVAINFSRTIIGIMIDASQIIMLTFVNGFSAAGAGNFINAFGVAKVLQFHAQYAGDANTTGSALIGASLLMGFALMGVACWVLITIVGTLLFRIAYLWFLIVLSPIAWLMSTFPAGKKYYGQWWDQFRDQLVVGPAMAFFLWLSLTAVGSGLAWNQVIVKGETLANVDLGVTQLLTSESVLSFLITVVLLVASKEMATKLASSAAGYGTAMKFGMNTLIRGKKLGVGAAKIGDLAQAQFSGIQFAKIPKGIKEGFAVRTKKLEEGAKKRAASNAAGLASFAGGGFIAQYAYNPLANTKMAIEKFATKGAMSRFRQSFFGTTRDKKRLIGNPQQEKDKKEEALKTEEKNYKEAAAGLVLPDNKEKQLAQLEAEKKLVDSLGGEGKLDFGKMKSDAFHKLALSRGWTTLEDFEDFTESLENEKGGEGKLARKMHRRAIKDNRRFKDKKDVLVQEKNAAEVKLNEVGADGLTNKDRWTQIETDYKANDAQRKKTKEEVKQLDEQVRVGKRKYVMGEMPYTKDLVRGWLDEEKDADKLYDWSKPANTIIDYFRHAGATGEQRHQGAALKQVAKKGDTRSLMEQEGFYRNNYKDANEWSQAFVKECLMGKYKFDERYAMETWAQVGELESGNGNWDLASHIKVDATTASHDWLTNAEHLDKVGKKFDSSGSRDVLQKTNHLSLTVKLENGKTEFTDEGWLLTTLMNEDPKGLESLESRGEARRNIAQQIASQADEIEKLDGASKELKKTVRQMKTQMKDIKGLTDRMDQLRKP